VEREVRPGVRLTGSVEARDSSLVAAEVEGLVERIPARDGETVRRGAPLVRLRTTDLELRLRETRGQLEEARARLELAQSNYERASELSEAGVISEREFDDAFSERAAWQGRVDSLTAQIEQVEVDLDRSVIRAPFDGVVAEERTEIGQWIRVGDPVAELVSLDRLEVRVEVPERYFPDLRLGSAASVTFESMPGLEIAGEVLAVVPRADPRARTFPIKVAIPNEERRIGAGMLAQVELPLGDSHRATLVPKDAIVAQGPGRAVYRIADDGSAQIVPVEVGRGMGSWNVVRGPLEPGDRVVTRGNERLIPGQPVQGSPLEYRLP
jgi:RND family efflux transporter MFP subunit